MRIFVLLLHLVTCVSYISAQTAGKKTTVGRSISLGFDISNPVRNALESGRTGFEGAVSVGGFNNFYPVVEAGMLSYNASRNDSNVRYSYFSSGKFFRIGCDFNIYRKNNPGENNLIFMGLRYAQSGMLHHAENILIADTIWYNRLVTTDPEMKVNTRWLELVGGMRVEITHHLALGWLLRYNILLGSDASEKSKPFLIPGYGRGNKTKNIGFTYTVYYTFPLVKQYR